MTLEFLLILLAVTLLGAIFLALYLHMGDLDLGLAQSEATIPGAEQSKIELKVVSDTVRPPAVPRPTSAPVPVVVSRERSQIRSTLRELEQRLRHELVLAHRFASNPSHHTLWQM